MADNDEALELLPEPVGRNGTMKIVAKLAGDVLHVDELNPAKSKDRERFLDVLCKDRSGIDRAAADKALMGMVPVAKERKADDVANQAEPSGDDLLAKMPESVRREALALLESPNLLKTVIDDVTTLGVAGEKELAATLYLCGVSRLLDKPMAVIVQGPSSSGKSYVVEKSAELIPPEAVIHAQQMTPQALFHMKPGSLCHRWIVAGERSRVENDDSAEATRALREMLSSGKLSKLMPMKQSGGEIVTQLIEQEGPIAFVESTTLSEIFDEDLNRCLLLHTDERPEQTRRIVDRLAKAAAGGPLLGDLRRVIERHHALQRTLKPMAVLVPFAERLADKLPADRVEVRRAFPMLLSTIRASALLHQRQRQIDEHGRLLAGADDYAIVRRLLAKPMALTLGGGLSDPARRFFERLKGWANGPFTTTDVKLKEAGSKRACYGWLEDCQRFGLVIVIEPGRGPKPAVWELVADAPDPADCAALPSVEELFDGLECALAHKAQAPTAKAG